MPTFGAMFAPFVPPFGAFSRRSRALAIPFAWTLASGPAVALEPLARFVEAARSASFDAREAREVERERTEETSRAWTALFPVLSTRAAYTRNQYPASSIIPGNPATGAAGRTVTILPEDQLDLFVVLDVPLVDVTRYGLVRAAKHAQAAASRRTEQTGLELDKQVARAYYGVVAGEALVQSVGRSLQVAVDFHALVGTRQEAGLATDLDVRRAAAAVERARQSVADAHLAVVTMRRSLETLSGLSPSSGAPALEGAPEEAGPVAPYEARAAHTPAVAAAEEDVRGASAAVSAAWGALVPSLAANATERWTNATGFAGKSPVYAAGVTATWRLEAGALFGVRVVEAAETLATIRKERAVRAAQDQAFLAWAQVEAGTAKSRAARAQVASASEAARLARGRYEAGRATALEAQEAERDAFEAEVSRIQADADLAYARAVLRAAGGQSLVAVSTKGAP